MEQAYEIHHQMAQAAEGDVVAQYNLGVIYFAGLGVQRDLEAAARWYRKAADQGSYRAQNNLGAMYKDGLGVPQDRAEAARLFRLSADQGNKKGQYNLAMLYAGNLDNSAFLSEAYRLMHLAAAQGFAPAQHKLGTMLGFGLGVERNLVRGYAWIAQSIGDAPEDEAEQNLETLASHMSPEQIAEAKRLVSSGELIRNSNIE